MPQVAPKAAATSALRDSTKSSPPYFSSRLEVRLRVFGVYAA